MNDRQPSMISFRDADRLWNPMLAICPVIGDDVKQAPQGCAQLVREHAQALLAEWKRAHSGG